VNSLFEGELTEGEKLEYVNNIIMGKLLESKILQQQALNSQEIREGIKDILLNYAGLWDALRARRRNRTHIAVIAKASRSLGRQSDKMTQRGLANSNWQVWVRAVWHARRRIAWRAVRYA
jgi:hypothetical protein